MKTIKRGGGAFEVSLLCPAAHLLVWASFFLYRWMGIRVCYSQNVIRK